MTEFAVTHVGGPTLLLEISGWRILTDPTFDPPGRRYRFGWGTSSTKTRGPALAASALGPLDAVLLTHDHHADNLDDEGRALLPSVNAILTTTSGARRLGGRARGLAAWDATTLEAPDRPTIEITATPCRHGPALSRPLVGEVVGFALASEALPNGQLWISGDTVLYDGVREVADRVDVDVAVLHVGGVRFPATGPLRYTMTIDEAIELAALIRPRVAVPVHYEGWSHFREGPATVEARLAARPAGVAFTMLPIGERTHLGDLR